MNIRQVLNPAYLLENRSLIMPVLLSRSKRFLRSHGVPLTANDLKVAALKDKHRGRRCFIIGSGPSLKVEDLERLKGEVTFACNKIFLAFDDTEWRPTYYSITDTLVAENNKSEINELNLSKIFEENIRPFFKKDSALWLNSLHCHYGDGGYEHRFSTNVLEGVYGGWTVIYMQMQLAFYMGIREIYLIGVDFSFEIPKPADEACSSDEILIHQGEINHFHPKYRTHGEPWSMPKLDLQYKAFLEAKRTVESLGGEILNASRKTKLDVFPVIDFEKIVP
jgi:hypothetical protein